MKQIQNIDAEIVNMSLLGHTELEYMWHFFSHNFCLAYLRNVWVIGVSEMANGIYSHFHWIQRPVCRTVKSLFCLTLK